jgi:hypothetical protein
MFEFALGFAAGYVAAIGFDAAKAKAVAAFAWVKSFLP